MEWKWDGNGMGCMGPTADHTHARTSTERKVSLTPFLNCSWLYVSLVGSHSRRSGGKPAGIDTPPGCEGGAAGGPGGGWALHRAVPRQPRLRRQRCAGAQMGARRHPCKAAPARGWLHLRAPVCSQNLTPRSGVPMLTKKSLTPLALRAGSRSRATCVASSPALAIGWGRRGSHSGERQCGRRQHLSTPPPHQTAVAHARLALPPGPRRLTTQGSAHAAAEHEHAAIGVAPQAGHVQRSLIACEVHLAPLPQCSAGDAEGWVGT